LKYLFLFLSILFFTSCSHSEPKKLKIAVNSWIGYTPLFYAKEKGYLQALNIQLLPTVSLGESADIFSVAKVDMLTATQHELISLQKTFPSLDPIILMDRSNGGDMILSNRTIKELQKSKHIDVYLEIDSINSEMIQKFTENYNLNPNIMTYINQDQSQIQNLSFPQKADTLIVTYTPYDTTLESVGFKEIASTKDINSILVIDAICATKELVSKYNTKFKKLKMIIDKSIIEMQKNPQEAHKLTARYLNNLSFKEYQESMKTISWINHPSKELLIELKKINYMEKNLI
jgi:NitT/TauT family transport system substrate-binding protein